MHIWHDVHNGSVSILSSVSFQICSVYPASSDIVDLCPNFWCDNPKENVFLGIWFCAFDFSFIFTKNACFLFVTCVNVTAFCSMSMNNTVKTSLWKSQVCIKFINVIMENNWSQKSGTDSTLYNVAMKDFPLSSCIFIWTYPVFSLWQNSHVQLQYIYPFSPMRPV